jgi:hypothetical protein
VNIGAGTGTWSSPDVARKLLDETSIDYLEMHLYPISKETMRHAIEMARLARNHGKRVVMSEAWLYKAAPRELTSDIAANAEIFKRDVYSFWFPLDREFLKLLTSFAQRHQVAYVSPFWSTYFFSSLPYDRNTKNLSYGELTALNNRQAARNIDDGTFSALGDFYASLLQ